MEAAIITDDESSVKTTLNVVKPPNTKKTIKSKVKTSTDNNVKKPSIKSSKVNKHEDRKDEIEIDDEIEVKSQIKSLKEEIDITGKEESHTEKATVNFASNDFLKKEVKKKTRTAPPPEPEKSETIEDVKSEIKKHETKKDEFTLEDFELFAQIIIDIVDVSVTSGLRWWAKDTSDTPYSITEKKRNILTKQLARLLVKYQARFSLEFMFIITIFMVYLTPARKANNHRKKVNEMNNKRPGRPKKKKVVAPPKKPGAQSK